MGYTETASPAKQRHNRGFDAAFNICLSAGPVQHEVLRNLEIVKALGGKVDNSKLEISLTNRDREFASKLLANVPASSALVAVGIGVGNERPVQLVIICSHDERKEACKLAKLLRGETIIVSGTPLRKVCAVLERCDLFIGNDSGSAHLAGAMNCKTIVISRHPSGGDPNHANSPIRFAPHCDRVRVLQPAAGLDACKAECLSSDPHCIRAVSVDQAVAAAREILLRGPSLLACMQANMASPHNDDSRPAINAAAVGALKKATELPKAGKSRPARLP